MDSLNRKKVREQLNAHGASMNKSLGQNYLVSERSVKAVLSHLGTTETIIEIGPGIGNLTVEYFKDFKKVILIELDEEKIPLLKENLKNHNEGVYPKWVEIVQGDFLKLDMDKYINDDYQILGALPYNISKKIITRHFGLFPTPKQSLFILQREVADKYVLSDSEKSFLAVSTALFAHAHRYEILKKTDFYPVPKVDSRTIKFDQFLASSCDELNTLQYNSQIVKELFSNPRKKLSNSRKKIAISDDLKFLLQKRPGELTLEEWIFLLKSTKTA